MVDTPRMESRQFSFRLIKRSGWLLAVIFILAGSSGAAADEGAPREVTLLAEGETMQYSTYAGEPADWYSAIENLAWTEGISGFGPSGSYLEVGTRFTFSSLKLRKKFPLVSIPATLTLSLRHEAKPFTLYLNGVEVLSLGPGNLPVPDAAGFRHYLVPGGAGALKLGENLFALSVEGSVVSLVLSGGMVAADEYPLTMKPGDAFKEEGRIFEFQVHRSYGFDRQWVKLESGVGGVALADFEVWQNGVAVPLSANRNGWYDLIADFPEGASVLPFQLRIRDDAHAEGLEKLALVCLASRLNCLIPPNDTMVSRTNPSGEGSLRQALSNAYLRPGPDVIRFVDEEGVPFSQYPVTLHPGPEVLPLRISGGVQIEGPETPGRVTIQANGGTIFYATPSGNAPLVLRRLVIQGASTALETSRYFQDVLVEDCEFIHNNLALDLYVRDKGITIRNCLFLGSVQGAVLLDRSGTPTKTLVENCTILDTSGVILKGGGKTTEVRHCTVTQSGPWQLDYDTGKWRNCLVSRLMAGEPGGFDVDCEGNLYGNSAVGDPHNAGGTAIQPMEPGLEPLAFNGGFTRTRAIRADSQALDLTGTALAGTAAYDQRGVGFPRVVGKSADAGAFERQVLTGDLTIGGATDVVYDQASGLYFQVVAVTNRSPWELSGFRLAVEGLPPGVAVYNTSGEGAIDFARNMARQSPVYLVIQYRAENPFLRIEPVLRLSVSPDATQPLAPPRALSAALTPAPDGGLVLEMTVTPQRSYRIEFSDDLKSWREAGPERYAESQMLRWRDDGRETGSPPQAQARRFYRVIRR